MKFNLFIIQFISFFNLPKQPTANFTFCCKYPDLVMEVETAEKCHDYCRDIGKRRDQCCLLVCILKDLEILKFSDGSSAKPEVNPEGLVNSFLSSVENDKRWEPIVRSSSQRCSADLKGSVEGFECEVIPNELGKIIDCCSTENYLKCPNYNPKGRSECQATREYVEECSTGYIERDGGDDYEE